MKHFALLYNYIADFREKRVRFRAEHIAFANASIARAELQLGGAFADDDPAMAMLVFKAEDPTVAEAFAAADPYVRNGLVTSWRVREWVTVVGHEALTKVTS